MHIIKFLQTRFLYLHRNGRGSMKMVCLLCLLLCGCSRQIVWEDSISADIITGSDELPGDGGDSSQTVSKGDNTEISSDDTAQTDETMMITVHVCGAVENPGVYEIPEGSRLIDAVTAAGGFADSADTAWCNQARYVEDQEQIRIYTLDETAELASDGSLSEAAAGAAGSSGMGNDSLINLNTATAEQLQTLPGIGESRAQAIIAYREENGAFSTIEEIMKISGIKDALFGRIKDRIKI